MYKTNTVDLMGKKVGMLTVLEATDQRINKSIVWKCKCSCGNIIYVKSTYLVNASVVNCGCVKKEDERLIEKNNEFIGKTFGRLTALEVVKRQDGYYVKCKCTCGNIAYIFKNSLTQGKTKSCGCIAREKASERFKKRHEEISIIIDLSGKTFGRLTVLEDTKKRSDGNVIWKCKCSCGNIVNVNSSYLRKGITRSCGCLSREVKAERLKKLNKENHYFNNLTGKTFGRLTAIEKEKSNAGFIWKCNCICGNVVYVRSSSLANGSTRSCGCLAKESASKRLKLYMKENSPIKDLTAQRFGMLVVIGLSDKRRVGKNRKYVLHKCVCDCGNVVYVTTSQLTSDLKTSCGCINKEKHIEKGRRLSAIVNEKYVVENTNINTITKEEPYITNKTGIRGVCLCKKTKKYLAYISFKKKTYRLGSFSNKEDAVKVRKEAESKIFGEFLKEYNSRKNL